MHTEDQHFSLWNQFNEAVDKARHQGNMSKASKLLKEALREAEEYGEIPPVLVEKAQALGDAYVVQHRFQEAELLFRSVLELREKLLGPAHADVAESLKLVAMVQILGFRAEALGRSVLPATWMQNFSAAS